MRGLALGVLVTVVLTGLSSMDWGVPARGPDRASSAEPSQDRPGPTLLGRAGRSPDPSACLDSRTFVENPSDVPTPAPKSSPHWLRGRVQDTSGSPIADVSVTATFQRHGHCYPRACGAGHGSTDGRGEFTIEIPEYCQWAYVRVGPSDAWVRPADRRIDWRGYQHDCGGNPYSELPILSAEPCTKDAAALAQDWRASPIALTRAASIRGIVLGPEGRRQGGAHVVASWPLWRGSAQREEVEADDSGRFAVIVPATAPTITLCSRPRAMAPLPGEDGDPDVGTDSGLVPEVSGQLAAPGDNDVVLHLVRAVHLVGRVVGLTPGFDFVWMTIEDEPGRDREDEASNVRVGNDGCFDLLVAPGPHLLVCTQWFGAGRGESTSMLVQAPSESVELAYSRRVALEGRLLGGEDLADLIVQWIPSVGRRRTSGWAPDVRGSDDLPEADARTKVDGKFKISVLDRRGTLYVRAPNCYEYALLEDVLPSAGPFDLRLEQGLRIPGRVEGLPPARRWSVRVRAERDALFQECCVDADGSFEILGLPPGLYTVTLRLGMGPSIPVDEKVAVPAGGTTVLSCTPGRDTQR